MDIAWTDEDGKTCSFPVFMEGAPVHARPAEAGVSVSAPCNS